MAEAAGGAGGYVAVIGAVNMDIWGRSFAPLRRRDSNPGEVRASPGGVGRNIAHNLRLLGTEVQMLTVLGGDAWGAEIARSCGELGIGLDRALRIPEGRTSSYLYVTGPEGEMELAVCDADIARYITPEVVEANLDLLNGAAAVVFDGNLTGEAIGVLTRRCRAPLFADPVSTTKAEKLRLFLDRIFTLKPNAAEAAVLTGAASPEEAALALARRGVGRCYVSDGAAGLIAAGDFGIRRVPCAAAAPVNTTGGGDAVLAGLVRSYLDGRDPLSAARYALAAGAIAVEWPESVNPHLSDAAVRARILEF